MEQLPSWEADSHPASQEIALGPFKSEVHFHVQKSPPLAAVLSQAILDHSVRYVVKICFKIILLSQGVESGVTALYFPTIFFRIIRNTRLFIMQFSRVCFECRCMYHLS